MSLRDLWLAWNKFWFAAGSPIPMALFRIAIGFLVLVFYWWISPEATTFFGTNPIVAPATVERWMGSPQLDVLSFLPSDNSWLHGALILLVVSGICLILGIFSRLNAFIVYLIMLSLDSRNHFVLNTGIKIMIIMTLFLVVSRCGEALSFKRLFRIWRKENPEFGPAKDGSIFGQRLMQVQMALVYWSAAACKLHGAAWIDGTAVYYAVHLTQFQRFTAPFLDQIWVSRVLSWGTLAFELSFPFLVWIKEFRYPLLLAGVLFHTGLDWAMVIPLFQLVMLSGYICFIDAADFRKAKAGIQGLSRRFIKTSPLVVYDRDSGVAVRLAETIRRLDVFNCIERVELQVLQDRTPTSPPVSAMKSATGVFVLNSAKTAWLSGIDAVRRVYLYLPLLWLLLPVFFLPGAKLVVTQLGSRLRSIYQGAI